MTSSLTISILKLKYGRAFRILFRSQIFDFSFRSNWFSIDICVIFTILFALSLKSADPIKPKSCAVELSSASKISKCWRRTRCLLSFCSGALFNIFRISKKFSRDKKNSRSHFENGHYRKSNRFMEPNFRYCIDYKI